VFKKDVWKKVNGFDENYHLYFEDDDFSEKVKGQGLKLVIDREVFIKHVQRGSANKRSDTNKYFDQSRKYFEFKWGRRWRP
jgi:GT2 family glycosyltransferase